jgi:hypothetical protein
MVDLYANFHYYILQMPIEKVNMYVGYSCPIMGIDTLGCTPLTTSWSYKYDPTWVLYVANSYLIVALPQIIQNC